MSALLEVKNLCKTYPSFFLDNVSFSLQMGSIMGFIGRNGAGKTTAIKSMLRIVHPDSGEIYFMGKAFSENEAEVKTQIGYAGSGISYYQRKHLRDIAATTKTFYPNWDEALYRKYMAQFSLDEKKKPIELSEGMKIKFQLVLALSHHARLLILDEPTSGLDPVSREELLEIFLNLKDAGVSVFFSTHITSDLDRCADCITYIQNGKILASGKRSAFLDAYRLVSYSQAPTPEQAAAFLGVTRTADGHTALIRRENAALFSQVSEPDLEEIMVHLEKGADK